MDNKISPSSETRKIVYRSSLFSTFRISNFITQKTFSIWQRGSLNFAKKSGAYSLGKKTYSVGANINRTKLVFFENKMRTPQAICLFGINRDSSKKK